MRKPMPPSPRTSPVRCAMFWCKHDTNDSWQVRVSDSWFIQKSKAECQIGKGKFSVIVGTIWKAALIAACRLARKNERTDPLGKSPDNYDYVTSIRSRNLLATRGKKSNSTSQTPNRFPPLLSSTLLPVSVFVLTVMNLPILSFNLDTSIHSRETIFM